MYKINIPRHHLLRCILPHMKLWADPIIEKQELNVYFKLKDPLYNYIIENNINFPKFSVIDLSLNPIYLNNIIYKKIIIPFIRDCVDCVTYDFEIIVYFQSFITVELESQTDFVLLKLFL